MVGIILYCYYTMKRRDVQEGTPLLLQIRLSAALENESVEKGRRIGYNNKK